MATTPTMSTAQQHTAMEAVNTGTGALDTANSMFTSGMAEMNKVTDELTEDANVMKGNLGGKLSGWRAKMKAKAEEAKANIAQRQAEFEQYKAANAQDIANGTRYQTGINNMKAQKEKAAANLKHFNDVIVPKNKKIFAEKYAAKKAEQHAKFSSPGDLANVNEGAESKGLGMSTGMESASGAMTVGGRKRRRRRKSRKKKSFKKHYMWNTRGKRYMAKTYKQHLKGLKLGHTHKKPKKRKTRKKKRRRRRKRGGHCGCAMSRKKSRRRRRR